MNGDHYKKDAYPPPVPIEPTKAHYNPAPRKSMDRTAVIGIVITSICFVMLFVMLFAPWMTVKHMDYWNWNGGENPKYEVDSYDYSGDRYGGGDKYDEIRYFFRLDSMDSGITQGFVGIILGMVLGIGMIVIGNIHLVKASHRKLMIFFRGAAGIAMLLPATFLMVCGSKFIGFSIYFTTSGSSESENVMICIVPFILFILGIVIFIMAFGVITRQMRRLSRVNVKRKRLTEKFIGRFRILTYILVILGMLAVVTLPLLPIISNTEGENDTFIPAGYILTDEFEHEADFVDYLGWVNFAFWFIFPLTLMALLAILFLESGINDLTGYILGLIPTLVSIFLVLALIFKILFIVDVFDEDAWYGYNYLPALVMIGLIVVCIIYMIHSIKGSTAYFKSISGHPAPCGYGAPPSGKDVNYHNSKRRSDHYGKHSPVADPHDGQAGNGNNYGKRTLKADPYGGRAGNDGSYEKRVRPNRGSIRKEYPPPPY